MRKQDFKVGSIGPARALCLVLCALCPSAGGDRVGYENATGTVVNQLLLPIDRWREVHGQGRRVRAGERGEGKTALQERLILLEL